MRKGKKREKRVKEVKVGGLSCSMEKAFCDTLERVIGEAEARVVVCEGSEGGEGGGGRVMYQCGWGEISR